MIVRSSLLSGNISAALAIVPLSAASPAFAAPTLKFSNEGLTVEEGSLKCQLAYPLPINSAKAKDSISEKTVSETTATLTYKGGGRIDLGILNGEVTLKLSGIPQDTRNLFFSMKVDTASVAGGEWKFDDKAGNFPAEKTGGQIHQGDAKSFAITPASGPGITLTLPARSFQQLMDLRQFQTKEFFWQCWLPLAAGTDTLSLKIGEAAAGSAKPTEPTPAPEAAEAKKSEPDRQSYGQLSGMPPEKKSGTRILKWQDGKQAAYLLGFDDNGESHLTTVIPELEKRKMVGNFYINPGGALFKRNQAKWEQAAKSPYVALHNHTFLHSGTQNAQEFEADLVKTSEAIRAMTPHLKEPRITAFRTPGGVPWKVSKPEVKTILTKYHMVDRAWLDGPPLTMKTLPPVLASVDTALEKGWTGFMDFHGVGGDPNSCPAEFLTALLDKLDEHREQFWITDTVSWFQYQDERKNAELKVMKSDATEVRASLTCSLDPVYYNYPLTVAIEVPTSWKACTITQGGKTQKADATNGEIRFDAVPGSDEIVIKP
jgi:Polysaccharide deacetylase.